jgi:hypothetical protein
MQVKGALFFVAKDGAYVNQGVGVAGMGSDDTFRNFGDALSYNTSKSTDQDYTKSIMARDNTTVKVAGVVDDDGFDTVGEVHMTFATYNNTYVVYGLFFGE